MCRVENVGRSALGVLNFGLFVGREAAVRAIILIAAALFAMAPLTISLALPVSNTGGTRCECRCGNATDSKDLDWRKTASCGSSVGKSCTFNNGSGVKQGTLKYCAECKAGSTSTEWICTPSAMSRLGNLNLPQATPIEKQRPGATPGGAATPKR